MERPAPRDAGRERLAGFGLSLFARTALDLRRPKSALETELQTAIKPPQPQELSATSWTRGSERGDRLVALRSQRRERVSELVASRVALHLLAERVFTLPETSPLTKTKWLWFFQKAIAVETMPWMRQCWESCIWP